MRLEELNPLRLYNKAGDVSTLYKHPTPRDGEGLFWVEQLKGNSELPYRGS